MITYSQHIQKIVFSVISLLLVAVSCTAPPPQTTHSDTMSGTTTASRQIPTGERYTGPVMAKIDTHLTSPVLASYGWKKTKPRKVMVFPSSDDNFSTQALPQGTIAHQESVTREKGNAPDIVRTFTADPTKRYTLHIANGDAQGNNAVTSAVITINGFQWASPNDFSKKADEVMKEALLLNASNTLTISVHGKPGSTMTLTVVEAGKHHDPHRG